MKPVSVEQNLVAMERIREAYWLRYPKISPLKLRWRAIPVRHSFHVLPAESILELGAGSGLWTQHLAEVLRGEKPIMAAVFNADRAEEAAGKNLPNVKIAHVQNLSLDLAAGGFDYIIGTAILCHDLHEHNLNLLYSLLKPGGQIV